MAAVLVLRTLQQQVQMELLTQAAEQVAALQLAVLVVQVLSLLLIQPVSNL
jgi:hypothetical protein